MEHWQVFHGDEQILKFIHNIEEFSNFNVIFQEEGKEYQGKGDQFDNLVPCGLVSLKHIFDRQNRRKSNIDSIKHGDYIDIDIQTNNETKMIKIGKGTSEKERNDLINIVKEYRDVFTFTYGDLN